jgi:omega-6 fatty acid desaturase (delta-12 desaturase)
MSPEPGIKARDLLREITPYREPKTGRSVFELAITAVPFALAWVLMWALLDAGYWLGLLIALPAGGLLVRLFMIQHDCGHGALFRRRASNDWVGRILGVLTFTPYDYWRRSHALHHAGNGNLDARGVGDIDTLTVAEFRTRSSTGRLLYRLYRHPIVLFGLGPAYLFLLRHRLPIGMMRNGWRPWVSTLGTNASIALVAAGLSWAIGIKIFLLIHIPITIVAASIGVWFFYVQHQFENTQWDHEEDWSFHEAAVRGSSHYQLPAVLRWFSANIGIHHVHHLASRVPFYRLPEVLRAVPALAAASPLTVRQSLGSIGLVLWDEKKRRLVSFKEARG